MSGSSADGSRIAAFYLRLVTDSTTHELVDFTPSREARVYNADGSGTPLRLPLGDHELPTEDFGGGGDWLVTTDGTRARPRCESCRRARHSAGVCRRRRIPRRSPAAYGRPAVVPPTARRPGASSPPHPPTPPPVATRRGKRRHLSGGGDTGRPRRGPRCRCAPPCRRSPARAPCRARCRSRAAVRCRSPPPR